MPEKRIFTRKKDLNFMASRKKTERVPLARATAMVKAFNESSEQCESEAFTKVVWFPAEQILEIAKLLKTENRLQRKAWPTS